MKKISMSDYNRLQQKLAQDRSRRANVIAAEQAQEKFKDPAYGEELKTIFLHQSAEQKKILNDPHLPADLRKELIGLDPESVIRLVKPEYEMAQVIGYIYTSEKATQMLADAFDADPSLVTQENFNLARAAAGYTLAPLDQPETWFEQLCRRYPELTKAHRSLESLDFNQRKLERDQLLTAFDQSARQMGQPPEGENDITPASAPDCTP